MNIMLLTHTELKKARSDLQAMKSQAESTSAEYDRLAEEHQKLLVCSQYFIHCVVCFMCCGRVCTCRSNLRVEMRARRISNFSLAVCSRCTCGKK